MSKPLVIFLSDIHLTLNPPAFRSTESDWKVAMGRQFKELENLACNLGVDEAVIAGDIFDKYNQQPELINWAIDNFPETLRIYAIPGQHDLPNHVNEDIHKSAYWTLVEAGAIMHMSSVTVLECGVVIHPFEWGRDIIPFTWDGNGCMHVAVVHRYIWKDAATSFAGAEQDHYVSAYEKALTGYDAAVFGDNHKGFQITIGNCRVFNCGTFFIRKSDEREYKPRIGILYDDGTIVPHYLDISKDVYLADVGREKIEIESTEEAKKFIEELRLLGSDSLDFRDALRRKMDSLKTTDDVRKLVLQAIGV